MTRILKNTTGSPISVQDIGVTIAASGQYEFAPQDYALLQSSTDVDAFVTSGDLVVNNGSSDLSAAEGLYYIKQSAVVIIQEDSVNKSRSATKLNFTGAVDVTNTGSGGVTVNITGGGGGGSVTPKLREVTMTVYPFGNVNTESNLLFDADVVNDTVDFLEEEII